MLNVPVKLPINIQARRDTALQSRCGANIPLTLPGSPRAIASGGAVFVPDLTLDSQNWSNFGTVYATSTADATATTNEKSMTGANAPVTIRATAETGGSFSATRTCEILVDGVQVAIANSGTFVEATINPAANVSFRLTNSNNTAFDSWAGQLEITNQSDGGAIIDTAITFELNVEGTDVAVTPAPAWANISGSATSPANVSVSTTQQQIQGTDARTNLRITLTSSMTSDRVCQCKVNGSTVAQGNSGTTVDFTCDPGDQVSFTFVNNQDGSNTWSGTATVTNQSNGGVTLDTFTYSAQVTSATVGATVTL